ncbi:MAG: OmpA family protein [Desulfobacteraceae bacterium]|jgi:chemotaxis protein MotB|nr:OmpA family protein [Desulfobacteraceae bacterium]
MNNQKWAAVAGVILLAGIVASIIFFQQRNDARQRWRESREQIAVLDRRNEELKALLEDQKSHLSAEVDLAQKKQAALKKDLVTMEADLNAQMTSLVDERDGLIAETTALKAEDSDLRARIGEMEAAHREAMNRREEKITALSSTLTDCDVRLDNLRKDEAVFALKLAEANRTITGLRDQLKAVIIQVPALKDRLEQSLEKYQAVREDLAEARAQQAELESRQKAMRETHQALLAGLKQQLDSKEASIEEYRQQLKVSFVDRILFGFSRVQISTEGKAALDRLAGVLATLPEGNISVVGHADSIPVAAPFRYRFPSNWELSSARAAAVARYLIQQGQLEPSRLEVVGLSSYQPIADNDTDEGRAKNRRVEIVITQRRYADWENR